MSRPPASREAIPEETAHVAQAAFRKGTLAMRPQDTVGTLYDDPLFADLFASDGRPAEAPWRLALDTVLRFIDNLSARQAALSPATRRRRQTRVTRLDRIQRRPLHGVAGRSTRAPMSMTHSRTAVAAW